MIFQKLIYLFSLFYILTTLVYASYDTNKVAATAHTNSCTASGTSYCVCAYCSSDTTEVTPIKSMYGDSCVCSASGGIKRYDQCTYTATAASITFTTGCTRGIVSTTLTPAATPAVNTMFDTVCFDTSTYSEGLGIGQTVCENYSGLRRYEMNTLTYAGTKYNHYYYCANGTNEFYLNQASSAALGTACSTSSVLGKSITTNHNNQASVTGASNRLEVGPTLGCQSLGVGISHTCALTAAGAAYCWGRNNVGQLGDASTTNRNTATLVSGAVVFKQIATGFDFSCGLNSSGAAYCWGANTSGQLGTGNNNQSSIPVAVSTTQVFRQISAGYNSACAVTQYGKVYCWGENGSNQLGDTTTTDRNAPVAVDTDVRFVKVSVGKFHACALSHEKRIFCWGLNNSGQLGDASTTTRTTPTILTGATTFIDVSVTSGTTAATSDHSCGLTSSGTVYCWGENGSSQLGNGLTVDLSTPVLVTSSVLFLSLKVGAATTCALGADQQYYCWGASLTATNLVATPGKMIIPQGVEAKNIGLGEAHGCLLTSRGEALCWGSSNTYGEFGDLGANSYLTHPTAIASGIQFAVQGFGACDL